MKYLDKILAIAIKLKTPLSIAGLTVIILYLIARQILALNVFDKIGGDRTYLVLTNILNKVFWFALTALVLGIICYILSIIHRRRSKGKRSDVTLVDASADTHMSPYSQNISETGIKSIKRKKNDDNDR